MRDQIKNVENILFKSGKCFGGTCDSWEWQQDSCINRKCGKCLPISTAPPQGAFIFPSLLVPKLNMHHAQGHLWAFGGHKHPTPSPPPPPQYIISQKAGFYAQRMSCLQDGAPLTARKGKCRTYHTQHVFTVNVKYWLKCNLLVHKLIQSAVFLQKQDAQPRGINQWNILLKDGLNGFSSPGLWAHYESYLMTPNGFRPLFEWVALRWRLKEVKLM